MNENVKKPPFIIIFIIGVIIGFSVSYYLFGCRNANGISGTLSTIKEQQSIVNNEIGNANNGIGNATNSVKQASSTVSGVQEQLIQSERIANDNASRISNITKIARECKSLAEENGAILKSVGKPDK